MEQPLLLNVDWLALSVKFLSNSFGSLLDGHFFIDYDGTNVWKYRRIIFNQYNEKVATLLYAPKSSVIASNAGLLEISNEWLYHGNSPDRIIEIIRHWRMFEISGMSRVDLAVDFVPTNRQYNVIKRLASGRAYVAGKRNGSSFWSVVNCHLLAEKYQGKKICHCQSWGHKTSQVKWKLYYKSKELVDAFGGKLFDKPYILDCWEEVGLDRSNVWRLEVSIKDANQINYDGKPITYEVLKRCPRQIFMALYTERFAVRMAEGHKDRTNDRLVQFLPVGRQTGVRCAKAKASNRRNPILTLLRHLISSLESEEVLLDDDTREYILAHVVALVEQHSFSEYFRVIAGENIYDWVESKRLLADEIRTTAKIPEKKNLRDIMERQARAVWETNGSDLPPALGEILI